MAKFEVHTRASAPVPSVKLLDEAEDAYGFVPNLLGVLAESPAALSAYSSLGQIFDSSSLSAAERQVVILAISRFNECDYCMAAHSMTARMQGVPEQAVEAIRNDQPIADARLEALRNFTTAVVERRGWLEDREIGKFLTAGFERAQVLDVILGISFKTLSNYVNHMADTPFDDAFAQDAWLPGERRVS
jgi:uncharacterized peroxidase-related enzyme